jgi:hypothetical protein
MTPASTTKKGVEYRYYRCGSKNKRGTAACKSRQLSAEAIEVYVVEQVSKAVSVNDFAEELQASLLSRIEKSISALVIEKRETAKEAKHQKAKGVSYGEQVATCSEDMRELLQTQWAEAVASHRAHKARLEEIKRAIETLHEAEVDAQWVFDRLQDFDETWELMMPASRGRLITALIKAIEVDEPAGDVIIRMGELGVPEAKAEEAA